ncbi:MAG: flavoprotein [Candidatus Omnitrophota bacterium]
MKKNILLGITGSIAAYKSCELIRLFQKKGYFVRCAMSRGAEWFVTQLTLETLTGNKAAKDMFALPQDREPAHISLAEEADVILVAPATADIIARVAAGLCDDILTAAICASSCPVIFAPAMNDKMYNNPIVKDNIKYLKEKGYQFIYPVRGELVCGREAKGHLAPLEEIVRETEKCLK